MTRETKLPFTTYNRSGYLEAGELWRRTIRFPHHGGGQRSSDDTEAVVRSFGNRQVTYSQRDQHRCAQFQRAIELNRTLFVPLDG
jgi:hypothetical protein